MPEATRQGPAWSQVHAEEGRAQKTEKGLLMARLGDADPDIPGHALFRCKRKTSVVAWGSIKAMSTLEALPCG